ncbi:MAG: hypothetical protein WDM96_07135 [Lacunisphaera sp.]
MPAARFTASENLGMRPEEARRPFLALAREEAERRVLSFMPAKTHRLPAKPRRGAVRRNSIAGCTNGEVTVIGLIAEE